MSTRDRNGTAAAVPVDPGLVANKRFADVPDAFEIPVADGEETVELELAELGDDPHEVCQLLEQEEAARTYWMTVAFAYAKKKKMDQAIETITRGNGTLSTSNAREKVSMVGCLCWMYLWKSREAPRVAPEGVPAADIKTKDYYLQLATATLNEASRINPTFPPLFLARGVLQLLRASLSHPSKASTAPGAVDPEKADLLRSALKAFEDAIRVSHGKNMMAAMGKARALYSLARYPEALTRYQEVLQKMPALIDPDPRIGIGCCFWQLGFKEDAKMAWERCLDLNPDSKHANILLGQFYLDQSSQVPTNSPEFIQLYRRAMTEYTQKSFKLDRDVPLTCATFAGYFLSRKNFANADSLAHRAIQYTDVNAIASDGWYLLARKEHYEGNAEKAANYYRRADDARGGTERGYLPAKFGMAQLSVVRSDFGEAKLLLEKMIQQSKSYEAMVLLGSIYAEEVFASQFSDAREDKSTEQKKAMALLENVRNAWKDSRKGFSPDASVLLNLARLYETDHPDKALQCLLHVEQLELDQLSKTDTPEGITDEAAIKAHLRQFLPPQLLNNIGCFHSLADKHELASGLFEAALGACVKIGESDQSVDTDALVTTITFNLGRSYESRGMSDQAVDVYEKLLKRHDDYTDARTRLAYIKLRKHPTGEGPNAVTKLHQENPADLEARALYGWYLGKVHAKKKLANVQEDDEFRHYKRTLQNYDKHDRYALVAMGNLLLMQAREMRRESDSDRAKRSGVYSRAVEFFEKALSLDPKNAYAAQGIAIAIVEDMKDTKTALPIFLKVRETIKDAHVYVNLGHIFTDAKQFTKAIENYETALSKEGRTNDPLILACLGRAYLNKGRSENDLDAYSKALECAELALIGAPDQVHYKFNVAFVQIQQVTTILKIPENQRSSTQLEQASVGLEAAIKALDEIATHPQTPYPKNDIEQRANMARNTLRKQLERGAASQREYEERNKEKLQAALQQREAAQRRREEERLAALEKEKGRRERLRKEREQMIEHDRELAAQRAEEDRARAEAEITTDSETGQKVKRKRKAAPREGGAGPTRTKRSGGGGGGGSRRKKKTAAGSDDGDENEEHDRHTKKKRRLAQSKAANSKFKSAEIIVDSDEDGDDDELERAEAAMEKDFGRSDSERPEKLDDESDDEKMDVDDDEEGGGGGGAPRRRRRAARVRTSDDDEDEDDEDGDGGVSRRQASKRARRGRIVDSDEDEEEEEEEEEEEGGGEKVVEEVVEEVTSPKGEGVVADKGDGDEKGEGESVPAVVVDTSMADADDDE